MEVKGKPDRSPQDYERHGHEWIIGSFFPGWKSQLLGGIGLRCKGQGLKEMYEADFVSTESSGCLELVAGGGSGSRYGSDF